MKGKRLKIDKSHISGLDPMDILSQITITPIEGSSSCLVGYDGKNYVSKNCTPGDIVKKIKKSNSCPCGGHLKL